MPRTSDKYEFEPLLGENESVVSSTSQTSDFTGFTGFTDQSSLSGGASAHTSNTGLPTLEQVLEDEAKGITIDYDSDEDSSMLPLIEMLLVCNEIGRRMYRMVAWMYQYAKVAIQRFRMGHDREARSQYRFNDEL